MEISYCEQFLHCVCKIEYVVNCLLQIQDAILSSRRGTLVVG